MTSIGIIITAYLLDLWLGDPKDQWHPVCLIGSMITFFEKHIRKLFSKTPKGELAAGMGLVILVLALTGSFAFAVLHLFYGIHPVAGFAAESYLCYKMLAVKSLKDASMEVYKELEKGDVEAAREAVSMIVGRDTASLTAEGVTKAAVETVAENTSDGVIAPLFYMFLGGGIGVCLYKAINTMDSMVGYRNDRYLYFGRTAARLDDAANWIPARLSALLMVAAAFLGKLDYKNSWRIYQRDRYCHKSPNSAHTEAVCAGALGVRLAGPASYFGTLHEKPFIGDDLRPIVPKDICLANRLLYLTSFLAVILEVIIWSIITAAIHLAGR